jgi:hypothetical protein
MTQKCNGCGDEIDTLGGVFSYGEVWHDDAPGPQSIVGADYHRTLCPRCQHVLKDILLNSDLSDHWHKYDFDTDDEPNEPTA